MTRLGSLGSLVALASAIAVGRPAIAADPIDVFVAPWCGYCRALERDLRAHRVPFFRRDIEADREAKREYERLGGAGVPLTRIGRRTVQGYDLQAILRLVESAP